MKTVFACIVSLLLFSQCRRDNTLSLYKKPEQVIAFQPLNGYPVQEIQPLLDDLGSFYNKQVIVLPSIEIPRRWYNTEIEKYSADSIIMYLSGLRTERLTEIVGITHIPVFTIREDAERPYYDEAMIGMGYLPGNACVVSDSRFRWSDEATHRRRLRNAIIHEIGHNMGLAHCANDDCSMSEKNTGSDYCNACRGQLQSNGE